MASTASKPAVGTHLSITRVQETLERRGAPSRLGRSAAIVVVPTYNEAGNIAAAVEAILGCGVPTEVLVVDDSSPDGTASVVTTLAELHPGRVHLLLRPGKGGLGAAYRAGLAWALDHGYDVIVQMDADGSHPADTLLVMVGCVQAGGADVVVGSRYVAGGSTPDWPLHRRLISAAANTYARTLLGLRQRDATCGFRAWRRAALALVDPAATQMDGYGFQVELSAAAHRLDLHVVEIPITFVDRTLGTSKLDRRSALEGASAVWRLRSQHRRPRPESSAPCRARVS